MSVSIGGLTIGSKGTRASIPLGAGLSYSSYRPWRRRQATLPKGAHSADGVGVEVLQIVTTVMVAIIRTAVLFSLMVFVGVVAGMFAALTSSRGRRRR